MTRRWYDLQLTRHDRNQGPPGTADLDLDDEYVEVTAAELYLHLRAAITRNRGDMCDMCEYALELREHGGRDVAMTYVTHGEVQR